jgi:hypothetical protein
LAICVAKQFFPTSFVAILQHKWPSNVTSSGVLPRRTFLDKEEVIRPISPVLLVSEKTPLDQFTFHEVEQCFSLLFPKRTPLVQLITEWQNLLDCVEKRGISSNFCQNKTIEQYAESCSMKPILGKGKSWAAFDGKKLVRAWRRAFKQYKNKSMAQ